MNREDQILATITFKADWHAFADSDAGFRYFLYHTALSPLGPAFTDLRVGSRIRFTPIDTPKGSRAILAEVVSL